MVLNKEKLIKHLNKLIDLDKERALKEITSDTRQTVIASRISAHVGLIKLLEKDVFEE